MGTDSNLPRTAVELNEWIKRHFQCFEGPPRAFFELPMLNENAQILRQPHDGSVVGHWRAVYVTVGFTGPEAWCCEQFVSRLRAVVSQSAIEDATEPLFIRRWAEYTQPSYIDQWFDEKGMPYPQTPGKIPVRWKLVPATLLMRFTFWDEQKNRLPKYDSVNGTFIDPMVSQ